jgi:hypothetical protein
MGRGGSITIGLRDHWVLCPLTIYCDIMDTEQVTNTDGPKHLITAIILEMLRQVQPEISYWLHNCHIRKGVQVEVY